MSQLISNYPIFEGSQVLTSAQLNQLSAYLDQQNRLTRSKLIGIGIVCGLKIKPLSGGLLISKGLGITSEGFLIQIGRDFEGKYYRPYTLPEGVTYKPFGQEEQDVTLHEILSEEPDDDETVKKLTNPSNFLNDKFVLLFLEIFDQDLKSCLGNSCDDRGQNRLLTLRRLLISKEDLDRILPERTGNVSGDFGQALELADFHLKRPLFSPKGPESSEWKAFVKNYQNPIKELLSNNFWENIAKGFGVFSPILEKTFDFNNPFESDSLREKIKNIEELISADAKEVVGIQYLYDFFKELVLAWTEFLETGRNLWYSCPTDPSLFPLHLMLGRARAQAETAAEFYQYRHGFVQPPIYNDQREEKERLAQQYRRLILMIETLELSIIQEGGKEYPVKITPSKEKYGILGERSIPYYYDIKSKGKTGSWYSLEKSWPDPQRKNTWSPQRQGVLSYDNQPDSPSEKDGFLESPLNYDLDLYQFYRVEGHLSQNLKEAQKSIEELVRQFNLPIHVHALHLDEGEEEMRNRCGWHDLQEEYAHQRLLLIGTARDIRAQLNTGKEFREKYNAIPIKELDETITEKSDTVIFDRIVESLPECLSDLDWEKFQEAYKELLRILFEYVFFKLKISPKTNERTRNQIAQSFNQKLLMSINPLLNKLVDLFFFQKIQRLYLSYLHRDKSNQNSRLFSSFLKTEPGLIHEAGSYRGGTFIILYHQKSERVIGDFSIPHPICHCEPCADSCQEMDWGLLPPFARPDFAFTRPNTSVTINVLRNDLIAVKRNYSVNLTKDQSSEGGKVSKGEEANSLIYLPKEGFVGKDSFEYTLKDEDTGKTDIGFVTILVQGEVEGCYSRAILECWSGGKIALIREILVSRQVNIPDITTDAEIYDLLLESLRKTKGFTSQELANRKIFGAASKRKLLSCLNISFTDNSDLDALITAYQTSNCGQTEQKCESTFVSGTITEASGKPIPRAVVNLKNGNAQTGVNDIGYYEMEFPSPGQTLVVSAPDYITQERTICNESTADFQLVHQNQREVFERYRVDPEWFSETEIKKVLEAQDITYKPSDTKDELLKAFKTQNPDGKIRKENLNLLTKDTLSKMLKSEGETVSSSETKAELINKFKRF
jgi:hypothetical protein